MLTNQGMLLSEQERNIIIMALMYLKNDYTLRDLKELGYGKTIDEFTDVLTPRIVAFEDVVQNLMEDIIGPTWDEEETTKNLKMAAERMQRRKQR